MNPETEQIANYIRDVANRIKLNDWTLFVSTDPDEEPPNAVDSLRAASFGGTIGRHCGSVWINSDYWNNATSDERRQTIVHELLHAHLHRTREMMIHLSHYQPKRTANMVIDMIDTTIEYAVDDLADVIAPFMPEPPDVTIPVDTPTTHEKGSTSDETLE